MIRLANINDADAIMEILELVKVEMNNDGNYQWNANYPLRSHIEEDIKKGEMYVYEGEEIEGFACISRTQPDEYETVRWTTEEPCLILRRMAVKIAARHKKIAQEFMLFAERKALEEGIYYIRTNTCEDNPKMQSLFSKMGYTKVSIMFFKGREEVYYCYDKLFGI